MEYTGPTEFVHLHSHTLFSILDGVASPDQYFKLCAERKWPAFAVTEHGVLNSIPDCYISAKETGVKQIVGIEFYFCDYERIRRKIMEHDVKVANIRKLTELGPRIFRNRHLTVLAKNENGYRNILKINREAYLNFFYRKPRTNFDLLAKYKDDLIVLSGCLNGPISHEIRNGNIDGTKQGKINIIGAVEYIKKFKALFGDDFYLELQMPGVDGDLEVFARIVEFAHEFGIKTVLTNDSHYLHREDYETQRIMMAIDQQCLVDDPNLFHVNSSEQFCKTRADLWETFTTKGFLERSSVEDFEAACNNTLEIAAKCVPFKPDLGPKLPKIENADDELKKLAYEGLQRKGFDKDERKFLVDEKMVTHREQLETELKRIIEKGFSSYFLITRDLIKSSTSKGWSIGPGRGSVGGSLLSYLIDIQSLNPLFWGTSFNRFMSPARGGYMLKTTMPEDKK